jgi:hypothetical protein
MPFSDALKIVTQEDIELAKRTPAAGDEVDPSKLMDLLGDIDGLKHEIHERMRRIEAVKQAKSVLLEDAERTEALNKRLAEIGKAMSVAHMGVFAGDNEKVAEALHAPAKENPAGTEARFAIPRIATENVALPWPRVEDTPEFVEGTGAESAAPVPELYASSREDFQAMSSVSEAAFEAALERLEGVEQARMQAWTQADETVQEARRLLDEANSQLSLAVKKEEQATSDFHSAQQALASAYESANERLEQKEAARTQAWTQANEASEEARRLLQEATEKLRGAVSREEEAAARFQSAENALSTATQSAIERLELAEAARTQVRSQTSEASEEAERLLKEATLQLQRAVSREEEAVAKFHSAKEGLTTAAQAAAERTEEAERSWRKTDQATQEAKRLLEQSTAELIQARKKEESISANLQSVRQEFMSAFESANERLREAEMFWKLGDQASKDVQQSTDQSAADLLTARNAEETAAADLLSARQELTTAYQFAAVAAQRRLDAVEFFHKAARWTIFAGSLSWVAMVWVAWFAFRAMVPIWGPAALTVIIALVAMTIVKRGATES